MTKKNILKFLNILIKGIYAGIMIGIGGTIFLALDNKIIGALLFAIGLFMICVYSMNLYTGKIGYLIVNKANYLFELLFTLIGNFLGTYLIGFLIRLTRFNNYSVKAIDICNIKLNDNLLSIFILSIFCGILMYLAVNNFKKMESSLGKYLSVFICVIVFILCGFEHCVANMYYFSVANIWSLKVFLYLFIMILGNSVGSLFIALYDKYSIK